MQVIASEKAAGSPHYRPETTRITYRSAQDGHEDWAMVEPGRCATWLISLHGHGAQGNQLFTRPDIAALWLPCLRAHGLGILGPNLRNNAWMCPPAVADLHDLIHYVRQQYRAERFLIASGSMGGTGALIYTVNHPEDIAAVSAFCGATDIGRYYRFCRANPNRLPVLDQIGAAIETAYGGTPDSAAAAYAAHSAVGRAACFTMPVFLCHGDNDAVIPVEESRTLVAELEKNACRHQYIELPNGHHDAPIPNYPQALEWLLANVRA